MAAHLIAEEGPHRGLILNLEEGDEWVIGRDPDTADFVVEDSTVSRKHARINKTPEGIYLKNLSRVNPVLVNDEEHTEPVLLKEGDRIQVGNTVFLFSEERIPDMGNAPKKPAGKKKGGYDDIFGDVESSPEEEEEEEETAEEPEGPPIPRAEEAMPPTPPRPPEATAYDTIFEDSGEEEPLPFNLGLEAPLLLKVISGPNAGAEIGIEKGRTYTIGKDSNSCDIVFQDLSVSRNHAKLSVSENGVIELEDLGSKNGTVVNGSVIAEKKVVTPQDLISLGTTVFMIVDREAPQETIYSPVVPSYEMPKEAEEAAEEAVEPPRDWKKEPIPTKYLIMAGSVAAVFLIMFLSFFSLFKSKGLELARKEPVAEIKEALAKFTDVQFSYNPGSGKLFLVGHVLTPVDYQEMKYRIGQIEFIMSTEDNVVIDEGVWKTMNDVISDNPNWRGVSIHSPVAGKFEVVGYIPTAAEATKLSEYLTVNFPYLDRLDNKVVVEDVLNSQLQGMIAAMNLGGVTYKLANGSVIITGRYNEQMASQFNSFVKELNAIPGIASVKNYAIASHPDLAGVDVTGSYQVSGSSLYDGRGYSIVLNGKIYTLGDQVDGMKITSIQASTILLEKDGLKYKIDYGRR
ncbi:MAG TPA: type III secretion system inner membrane ring subunit SctD [Chlamydiales bacterium]|nr:type III secretion system inner membrane ring subunit SctD [Chlamydiales bacterium]